MMKKSEGKAKTLLQVHQKINPSLMRQNNGINWREVNAEPWTDPQVLTVTNEVSSLHGYSVKERREFDDGLWQEPTEVYFVYMRMNDDGSLFVRHFREDRGQMPIADFENIMLNKMRDWWCSDIAPVETEFNKFAFDGQPCYVSFILDEENMKIHPYPENDYEETVVFRRSKLITFDEKGGKGARVDYFDPNYSFFNFERFEVNGASDGKDESIRQGFRFVNFMKGDRKGETRATVNAYISMDIYVKMPYAKRGDSPQRWLTVVFDPPEPSQGPPPNRDH
jgi:hypothetical protein